MSYLKVLLRKILVKLIAFENIFNINININNDNLSFFVSKKVINCYLYKYTMKLIKPTKLKLSLTPKISFKRSNYNYRS